MMRPLSALAAACLLLAACSTDNKVLGLRNSQSDTTSQSGQIPWGQDPHAPAMDSIYLSLVDGASLPCCSMDSAGVRITTIGGALTFYRLAEYPEYVNTPGGRMPKACVHGIPSGAVLDVQTGLVKYADGTLHLILPCDLGIYALGVIRQLSFAGGKTDTSTAVLSRGAFAQVGDALALVDSLVPGLLTTYLVAPIITVQSPTHEYRFAVPCGSFCGP